MSWEIRLLGPLQLLENGELRRIGPAKRKALLAFLALEANHPVSVDRLAEALWAGTPPRSAVANIRTYVYDLRRVLGERIGTHAHGYALRAEPGELDIEEFVRLAESGHAALAAGDAARAAASLAAALHLWRGPAGDGLTSGTALDTHFAWLTEQRLTVFEDLVAAQLDLQEHGAVAGALRRHLTQHPLRERAWAQLMLALYRVGDPAAALGAYRQAREALREQLGVEPGPELAAMHRDVLDSAAHLASPSSSAARVRVRNGVAGPPRQLPPVGTVFVGRVNELADLTAAVRRVTSHGPAVVVVSGAGGVGKSALAIRAGHLLAPEFPDGQLYINLHNRHPGAGARSTGEVPAAVLRALGVPGDEVPEQAEERASQYRSLLASSRVLVLVDNATTPAQARALAPGGGGSALLATSRFTLGTLESGARLPVGPLSDENARLLLTELVGDEPVRADRAGTAELIRVCAGMTLALRIAGARLSRRPGLPIGRFVRHLAEDDQRLDMLTDGDLSVRECLAVGYRAVESEDETAARVFRLLGSTGSAELTTKEATARLGVPVARVVQAFDRLLDAHMVRFVAPDRYLVPELLRQYAAELARTDRPGPELTLSLVGTRTANGHPVDGASEWMLCVR
jgi:DNA-binding SARP family transcriptional activator